MKSPSMRLFSQRYRCTVDLSDHTIPVFASPIRLAVHLKKKDWYTCHAYSKTCQKKNRDGLRRSLITFNFGFFRLDSCQI